MKKIKISDISKEYKNTDLSSNMEDYIEAIAMLSERNRIVRVKDIAGKLNIKMPSVTAALSKLKEVNLIEYEKYGFIELTGEGKRIAERICQRHFCLKDFFQIILLLSSEEAEDVACKLEHDISPEACRQIHKFLDFYNTEENLNRDWTKRLKNILSQ